MQSLQEIRKLAGLSPLEENKYDSDEYLKQFGRLKELVKEAPGVIRKAGLGKSAREKLADAKWTGARGRYEKASYKWVNSMARLLKYFQTTSGPGFGKLKPGKEQPIRPDFLRTDGDLRSYSDSFDELVDDWVRDFNKGLSRSNDEIKLKKASFDDKLEDARDIYWHIVKGRKIAGRIDGWVSTKKESVEVTKQVLNSWSW